MKSLFAVSSLSTQYKRVSTKTSWFAIRKMYSSRVTCRGGSRISSQGGALKKIASNGGRRENIWGISCEKSRFYAKKSYFFPISVSQYYKNPTKRVVIIQSRHHHHHHFSKCNLFSPIAMILLGKKCSYGFKSNHSPTPSLRMQLFTFNVLIV